MISSLGLQDKVRLPGWLSDIPAYLRSLHLYIQPSAYEGMCLAAHEAMAAGLPVVATPVGELRRSIQPGVSGVLLDDDIVGGIVTATRDFIAHPEMLGGYGDNARAYVERTMGSGAFTRNGTELLRRIETDILKASVTQGKPSVPRRNADGTRPARAR
jgi:glycosyltransferase involved in cell wall biosynthesis